MTAGGDSMGVTIFGDSYLGCEVGPVTSNSDPGAYSFFGDRFVFRGLAARQTGSDLHQIDEQRHAVVTNIEMIFSV